MDVIQLKFGNIMRDLLEERNLSQKQLANDLNISASAVGNYVRNNREPDFETLKKIAKYFQVSTDFLLNYHSEQDYSYEEQKILQIFRALTEDQKELYMEQGKLLIRCSQKKKGELSPLKSNHKAV
jgi:transcriptional regulator with XRE-family HTH domain